MNQNESRAGPWSTFASGVWQHVTAGVHAAWSAAQKGVVVEAGVREAQPYVRLGELPVWRPPIILPLSERLHIKVAYRIGGGPRYGL